MKFRKKPVVIEATQWEGIWEFMPAWVKDHRGIRAVRDTLEIQTLEGTMTANRGDWVIQGIKGEVYGCKSDIFEATYEPVGESK